VHLLGTAVDPEMYTCRTMGRLQHAARSVLSGRHPLARTRAGGNQAASALQLLADAFSNTGNVVTNESPSAAAREEALARRIVEAGATSSSVIVPRRHNKLPYHLLPSSQPQPWELLPMRAAALSQYPNICAAACLFFSSLQSAVQHNQPVQLVPCNKVGGSGWRLLHCATKFCCDHCRANLCSNPHRPRWTWQS
jgi:hypothetical protein